MTAAVGELQIANFTSFIRFISISNTLYHSYLKSPPERLKIADCNVLIVDQFIDNISRLWLLCCKEAHITLQASP